MTDGSTPRGPLNAAQRSTLAALAQTVLPHLFEGDRAGSGVVDLVNDRLLQSPETVTKDLTTALSVLGSRAAGLVVTGRPTSFVDHPAQRREQVFARWGTSWIPAARTVHQALRRLILTTWYATDGARTELGVHPPLHGRSPVVPWEGPLRSEKDSSLEVVARARSFDAPVPRANPGRRPAPAAVTGPDAISGNHAITADVVVIGSGAGGAVAAARFAESHRDVVILEAGEYLHAPDFTELERDMVPRLYAEQAMRTTADASVSLLQGGAVGGGTTVNWMLMLRPADHVLDEWTHRLHLPGFSPGDLAGQLDRVGAEVNARTVPYEAHAPSNLAIIEGARALGWRARTAMINARGCVRAGTCSLGCRYDAKQSALLTHLPRAFAAGARLFAGASVERIAIIERDHPSGSKLPPRKRVHATVRDPRSGDVRGRLTVDAPIVVLAAGAVETPVILQRSGMGGGGVGRYLRLHPTTGVMGQYAEEAYPLAGIPQSALCDEFATRDANGHGFWIECPALQPAIASAALQGFGAPHRELMHRLKNTRPFIVLVRDGSSSDASMGAVRLDRGGRVRITHRLTGADRENLRLGIEAAARLHLAAGAHEAISLHSPIVRATGEAGLRAMRSASVAPNRVALFSAHVNGTCRLGVNPATSGCSPSGERHGVRGLYVMDGSLLPTAPGVNPQWTIMAIASLLAERAAH
jgi:choline dehydrogenase-like flavoprotein